MPYELIDFTQTGTVNNAETLLESGQPWHANPEDKPVLHRQEFPTNNAVITFR